MTVADDGVDAVSPVDADDEGRVTEIGVPEAVDRAVHPSATAVGIGRPLLVVVVVGLVALSGLMSTDEDRAARSPRSWCRVFGPSVGRGPVAARGARGSTVDVRYEPNEVAPVDVVVDQDPIAGARLEVGEQVVLGVSDGPAGARALFGN